MLASAALYLVRIGRVSLPWYLSGCTLRRSLAGKYDSQPFVEFPLTLYSWISIPWLYAAEVNGLSMRGKAASLGKCAPDPVLADAAIILSLLTIDFLPSNCLRLARQLPRRSSDSSRHTPSPLGLLLNLRHHKCIFVAAHILLPRRNSRSESGRNRSMVPQQPWLVRPQSRPLPRSTKRQTKWTKAQHSLAPERWGLRSDDGRL